MMSTHVMQATIDFHRLRDTKLTKKQQQLVSSIETQMRSMLKEYEREVSELADALLKEQYAARGIDGAGAPQGDG